jgi:predicted PurR-regulated permease PerM
LITGTLCGITFFAFGLDSPLLWAFVLFIMNFIPVIGSLLAVFFPTFFALIQFGDFSTPALMLAILIAIQMVIGNILEPKIMGDSLNISPLVALFSLAFWGAIWGITGMLVSVPITVILIILLAHFPSTKNISILLSNTGKV